MLEAALAAILGAIAKLIKDLVTDRRRDQSLQDLGAARAEADLAKSISEIADDHAEIAAADRGGADDVARRLHDRLSGP